MNYEIQISLEVLKVNLPRQSTVDNKSAPHVMAELSEHMGPIQYSIT